ncbi:AAA family ATPase [Methanobrevibacter sp.]|uniref:AAA family ATPase n=1 Tax=Methanobrevibacter sp. TaxID=66852 RepID=UPI00386C6105
MMYDVIDLRGNLKNLEDKQAYVKWWAKRREFDLLLDKLEADYDDIKDALDIKDDLYCIYVGQSKDRSISGYLNMQFNQNSTFRISISSIISSTRSNREAVNNFMDKLKIEIFPSDFPVKSEEAKNELENLVNDCLEKKLYILNITKNYHPLAKNIKNNLSKLRKEADENEKNNVSLIKDKISQKNEGETTSEMEIGDNKMWFVTAGRESVKYDVFKKRDFVAIGWELGDLTGKSKEYIEKRYIEVYGNIKSKGSHVSQINKFVNEIGIGDYIITSKRLTRTYLIGMCTSDYFFSDKLDDNDNDGYYNHCRYVEWFDEIGWEDLCTEAKDVIHTNSVYEIKKGEKDEFLLFFPFNTDEKRNKIYFGAPGTGKSYNLNEDKDKLLADFKDNFERVTFHPDYTYANFVGTYKPVPNNPEEDSKDESISYKYVPGPFMRTLIKAFKNPYEPFVLIIEEINRANVAAVFGDVFQLLDRNNVNDSQYPINASEDINDYLTEKLDISEIPEDRRCIINKYWKCKLGEKFEKVIIPKNMFIWATMNSADQGVFAMDTAFKRRWDFKYFSINHNEKLTENIKVNINGQEVVWNELRKAINEELLTYKINEDKLLGPFFAFNEYQNKQISESEFKEIFKNKIIMYLFEDAAKSRRNELFSGVAKNTNITYSQICEDFDKNGIEIFTDSIKEKFIKDDGE